MVFGRSTTTNAYARIPHPRDCEKHRSSLPWQGKRAAAVRTGGYGLGLAAHAISARSDGRFFSNVPGFDQSEAPETGRCAW